jgi:hypothetical protein
MSEKYFLVGIGNDGLEIVYDMTDENPTGEKALMDVLAGETRAGSRLPFIMLRCRFNSHRDIKLKAFKTEADITEKDLWEMFEKSEDSFVEMVNRVGVNINY